jgi:formylglycine-generating enzyme required for sulfatase activity
VSPTKAEPQPQAPQPQAPAETAPVAKSSSTFEIIVDRSSSFEGRKPGQGFRDCADCPEMVVVAAGQYGMGSPASESGRGYDEGPQHKVAINAAFAMSRYEITFDQWDLCFAEGGCASRSSDRGWGRGRRPVINVSWNDASSYIQWLNKKSGQKYRLPSEAEWEFAARGGSPEANPWRNDSSQACRYSNGPDLVTRDKYAETVAADCRDGHAETAPVGSYAANEFGLNDMLGNVWEWTADCYQDSYAGTPADGSANSTGDCSTRTLRGGGWNGNAYDLRVANRLKNPSGSRLFVAGFRVVRGG